MSKQFRSPAFALEPLGDLDGNGSPLREHDGGELIRWTEFSGPNLVCKMQHTPARICA
jgi:hypothetical protein